MIDHDLPQYTITIDYVLRGLLKTDFEHTLTMEEIQKARPLLFDFDYGISDEQRIFFETSFLLHFMYREIAVTPLQRWKQYLMEYCFTNYAYIESVMETAKEKVNYLKPFNYDENSTSDRTIKDTQENVGNGTMKVNGKTVSNDNETQITSAFPQATLNDMDYASGSSETETSGTVNTDNATESNSSQLNKRDGSDVNVLTIHKEGNTSKSYGEIMKEFYLYNTTITGKIWSSMAYLFFSVY